MLTTNPIPHKGVGFLFVLAKAHVASPAARQIVLVSSQKCPPPVVGAALLITDWQAIVGPSKQRVFGFEMDAHSFNSLIAR